MIHQPLFWIIISIWIFIGLTLIVGIKAIKDIIKANKPKEPSL